MPLLWWRELRGMAVQPASTPLPPNVHVVYEVLCDEGPQTGRALERLLARRGVVVPVDRLRRAAEATRGRPSLLPGLGAGRPVPAAGRRALGDAARRPGRPTGAGPRRRPRRSCAAAAARPGGGAAGASGDRAALVRTGAGDARRGPVHGQPPGSRGPSLGLAPGRRKPRRPRRGRGPPRGRGPAGRRRERWRADR